MIRNALTAALISYALLAGAVLKECVFLAPLKGLIWNDYGNWLVAFSAVLFLNLFAASYALMRKVALKNTGDKLAHLEKQLRGNTTISQELTEQIREHRK
jgi:hypothetical protein